jgi:hypothetical protein
MPGRPKSVWKQKDDELKAQLPKGFDARLFRGARKEGKLDKDEATKVINGKKWIDYKDSIIAFLTHLESKPVSKKRGAKKQKALAQEPGKVNLLAKRTYSDLSATEIGKVIAMLTEIQNDRKESEIAGLKAKKDEIEKQLKELQGK